MPVAEYSAHLPDSAKAWREMDNSPAVPADFLGTTFARLGQLAPDPADTWFGLVFRFAGPCPSPEEVRARVAARLGRLPRLTERLVARASVQWERDPDFDLAHHVRTLPAHTGVLTARDILAGQPDPARPPWGLWLAPDEDGWRLYYLVHHARQDAAGALRTVRTLLGDDEPAATPAPDGRRGKRRGWSTLLPISLDLLRSKTSAPPVAPRAYGLGRAVATAEVDVALLTEVAARTGATVNQVHLTAMSAALDRWAPGPSRRPVNIPVDTREPGDPAVVNRLGFMRVDLPCGDGDRLRAVRAAAGRGRTARYRRVWRALTSGGGSEAAAWATQRITDHTRVAMTLSSIRIAEPVSLLGQQVLTVTALPWLPPAHTGFAFFTTYGDRAALAVLTPEGAPDPAALAGLWTEAVHDLHHAHAPRAVAPSA